MTDRPSRFDRSSSRPDENGPESVPFLLAQTSRVSSPPETPRRPSTMRKDATPPLAGVDWANPGAVTLRLGKAGLLVAALLLLLSIFADLVASDLPILCKVHGTVFVLPNVTRPAELDQREGRLPRGAHLVC